MKRVVCTLFFCLITLHSAVSLQEGYASWYGGKFHGRKTANGEIFDSNEFTAAHRTLPFGTLVKVTNLANGLSVIVRINDRGPFVEGRIIDLSRAAAAKIGMAGSGVAHVRIEPIGMAATDSGNAYDIQVASFGNSENLNRAIKTLKNAGFDPEEESLGHIVRVIIPNVPEKDLNSVKERLAELGFHSVLPRKILRSQ
ncbi:MAG TPA: septal ring lytic transglycosylase RlpA family protein [Spirochaetia bacterium]|jgi:rare lipoprotein A|nr:septal ring lytic transglycosylase RlpA family protein [Spirochaetia bacterium]